MKFDQHGKPMCFRAGSASVALSAASQHDYFNNSRADEINFGKVGHLASLESMSMVHLIPWDIRETDRETVTNYCVTKIIIDNAAAFKSKKMISFFHKFHITLGHSTTYYPQGNGLAESSNKSLINIIKNVLEENKKNWHKKLVNSLWADRLSNKRSIGMSPYELVYGMEAKFPSSLGIPVIKLLQEIQAESNEIQRRINQTIHL